MRRHVAMLTVLALAVLVAATTISAQEQEPAYPAAEPVPQGQPAPQQVWSADQLDNLVAPIALYPDPLLGQLLVASTYPLEVVEANQWLQRNRNLRGQELINAAKQQPWDPSIQALVAVPDALAKLNQDIRWTTDLGNAFLSQQSNVMDAVQRMRTRARDNGRLASTPQQTVTTQDQGGQQAIVIQPASPEIIYVPTYDPFYVWGPPVYGYYPALYYPSFGFGFGMGFDLGFYFGGWGGWGLWGWGPSWFGHSIYCNNFFFNHYGFHHGWGGGYRGGYRGHSVWTHDPIHRMNVPYANSRVAARFGGSSTNPRSSFRGGNGSRAVAPMTASRNEGRSAGHAFAQGSRSASPQVQRSQNPSRQPYQTAQSFRNEAQSQRGQSPAQSRFAAPQPYRGAPQQFRESPRVVPFGGRSQQSYQAPQQYRSAPQAYGAPQVQRFQAQPQMRYQAPQQYRSAPQASAPHISGGGGFSRGSGGGGGSRGFGGGSSGRGGGHHR